MERGLEYPLRQVDTGLAAAASQLGLVANRQATHDRNWHSYGIIKRFIPEEVPAMRKAREQHGELHCGFARGTAPLRCR
jgi:hypothetical protein